MKLPRGGEWPPTSASVSPVRFSTTAFRTPELKEAERRCADAKADEVKQQEQSEEEEEAPAGLSQAKAHQQQESPIMAVDRAHPTGPVPGEVEEQHEEEQRDDDGAVFFREEESGEARKVRTPPEVPAPSAEMVRRHKAAGHCPYRAWCTECVQGACNMPSHPARKPMEPGATP